MRKKFECDLAFTLMNSFATSGDTISYLKKYKGLAAGSLPLEFVQNKAPKVGGHRPPSRPHAPHDALTPPSLTLPSRHGCRRARSSAASGGTS